MPHPLERKLRVELCPYLVTSRHLNRWRPYQVYTLYAWLGEAFVLIAGLGLGKPLAGLLAGTEHGPPEDSVDVGNLVATGSVAWPAIALLLGWGLLKFYVSKEDLAKRCTLITSYRRQCLQLEFGLRNALAKADPMPDLINLQSRLTDLVDRNIAEGSIPGTGIDSSLQTQIDAYCDQLVNEFSASWQEAPDGAHGRGRGGRP